MGRLIVGNSQTVAPPSCFDGKPYRFFPKTTEIYDGMPLVKLWPVKAERMAAPSSAGHEYDKTDVAALVQWMAERGEFEHHDVWMKLGAALRLSMGDDGLELWQISHDSSVTDSVETSKWRSFATEPKPGCVTLLSLMKKAHTAG